MNEKLAYWSIPKEFVIVRCKDCKYRDKCHREIALKEYDEDFDANYVGFQKLTFCSYGKRREDGN